VLICLLPVYLNFHVQLFSPKGIRSIFNTHDMEDWKVVRKVTAPAFRCVVRQSHMVGLCCPSAL
jgi:hypothetical protein